MRRNRLIFGSQKTEHFLRHDIYENLAVRLSHGALLIDVMICVACSGVVIWLLRYLIFFISSYNFLFGVVCNINMSNHIENAAVSFRPSCIWNEVMHSIWACFSENFVVQIFGCSCSKELSSTVISFSKRHLFLHQFCPNSLNQVLFYELFY